MTNVVDIHHRCAPAIVAEPCADVITQLEWLLEAARSGEVQGLVGAFMYRDGTACGFSNGFRNRSLIGALEVRKQRLVNAMIEDE